MAVWEYKILSSGKGGFATPALLESFLNQLGKDEWEIVEFRSQPDNSLAVTGLARRPTQRDWTLEDAAAAAARAEADKLRAEFEAKFRGNSGGNPSAPESAAAEPEAASDDGLRRLRDTERDQDPDAPEEEGGEDEWDKLGGNDELPTFFEALRPHFRRNQRGPGMSVGVDFLAKKWDMSEEEIVGALKECGLTIPEDEDDKSAYVEYDGDLFWANVNRRGELWINTKEKPRPVFRTVKGLAVAPAADEGLKEPPAKEAAPRESAEPAAGETQEKPPGADGRGAHLREAGPALLDRIRPLMRRNRREPGGSGSVSFLSRALKCSEGELIAAFETLGLSMPASPSDKPVVAEIGDYYWWINKDQRGAVWIQARERTHGAPGEGGGEPAGGPSHQSSERDEMPIPPLLAECAPAAGAPVSDAAAGSEAGSPPPRTADSGMVLAAVRLLLKETRTGSTAATLERVAGELGKTADELLAALTGAGLSVPEKPKDKPVFVEHAGEIFWINRNAKGELWINAKTSKFARGEEGEGDDAGGGRGRRPKKRKDPEPAGGEVVTKPAAD